MNVVAGRTISPFRLLAWLLLINCSMASPGGATDWPCYQNDARRSGVSSEKISMPLANTWVYEPAQPPRPAWPEPGRELHRIDFDYAPQPVIAQGLVIFGSSADDTVRALDAASGELRWQFTTAGPVRFAQHVVDGKCYVASDDGFLYCLDAGSGNLVWKFLAAPNDRQLLGNGRMISRWPCRSGVLVDGDVVFVAAGMWPAEGIYVYAIDRQTGKQLWCNDTSGCTSLEYPHRRAFSLGGVAPQGYLLASENLLLVPTGRSVPAAYDRRDGRLTYWRPGANKHNGGCWATIADGLLFNPAHGGNADAPVELGESGPRSGDGMIAHGLGSGRSVANLPGRHRVLVAADTLYAASKDAVEAIDLNKWRADRQTTGAVRWTIPFKRAYSLALAGRTLLVGGAGSIAAIDVDAGKEVWQADVEGQVRGIAASDGRLVVTTNQGSLLAFEHRGEGQPTVAPRRLGRLTAEPAPSPTSGTAADVVDLIKRERITKGYALVVGGRDARFAEDLASKTELHVISLLSDASIVTAERERLVRSTSLYGTRVVVQHSEQYDLSTLPTHFANVVVAMDGSDRVSGEDLYRVLRPCGGTLCFLDVPRANAERLLGEADVPPDEVRPWRESLMVVRGKLPGAFDWDSEVTSDHRLKWPLELLWFGGPGPDRMVARHWRASTPVPAAGRYFVLGERHIVAVDAYNGCQLWARELPGLFPARYPVAADDDNVYVTIGKDKNAVCVQLDARTGDLVKTYSNQPDPQRFSLVEPQTIEVAVGDDRSGEVTLRNTPAALELTLLTRDADVTPRDSWELYFDFRPATKRYGLYGRGTFHATVDVTTATWRPGNGPAHPNVESASQPSPDGTRIAVHIPWKEIEQLVGQKPQDFSFACALNAADQDQAVVQVRKFCTLHSVAISSGWAVFSLGEAASEAASLRVDVAPLEDLPEVARGPGRLPRRYPADPELLGRTHPLTDTASTIAYRRGHGCGGEISSATMQFLRSATIGMYDLEDDSGMRNFGGIRPGCGVTLLPAMGLLISSEGSATCSCSYSFQTSLAMAPASKRKNEDWAVFYDAPVHGTARSIAMNLGAPGDRRDDNRLLWLGYPRPYDDEPELGPAMRLSTPFDIEVEDGFGPYRQNADRVHVSGTDRPWLYTSGVRGLRKAVLNVECLRPIVSVATRQAPKIDGRLDEPCWDESFRLATAEEKGSVLVRHDADNLFIGYRRPAEIDRRGQAVPWKATTTGKDAAVWNDDAFEVLLSDSAAAQCIHLGAAASSAQYDALWRYVPSFPVISIPHVDSVTIDGNADDWQDHGFHMRSMVSRDGTMCPPDDFDPTFRLGWNDRGMLLVANVRDQTIVETENPRQLPQGDSIEIYMTRGRGGRPVFRLALGTGADPAHPELKTYFWDRRTIPVTARLKVETAARKTDDGYVVEALLPWRNLQFSPRAGTEIGVQIHFNDSDGPNDLFQAAWHPGSQPLSNRNAYHRVQLADAPTPPMEFKRGNKTDGEKLVRAESPYPYALRETPLGRSTEDSTWQGPCAVAVHADETALTVEMAIPWKTLADVGLVKKRLLLNLTSHGVLSARPTNGFQAMDFRSSSEIPTRPHTVRLHFAEMTDIPAGQRLFNVKIQGETVLEDFDIVKEAGGSRNAIVREFRDVQAADQLIVELVPKAEELTDVTAPILSAIEVEATQ